jgi:seryl-tRNA synthetase
MLDIREVRKDTQAVAEALAATRLFVRPRAASKRWMRGARLRMCCSQQLQAERKSASKKIGQLISEGMSVDEAKASVEETTAAIAAEIDDAEREAREVQAGA